MVYLSEGKDTGKRPTGIITFSSSRSPFPDARRLYATQLPGSKIGTVTGEYKVVNFRLFFGAESFFFEEGQADVYENAVYGGLKVNGKGQSLLIGLYNEKFQLIQPEPNK